MTRLTIILTPRGRKSMRYGTSIITCRQLAERQGWRLTSRNGQLAMEERQHG